MAKKNRPKKSKALVVWAIVTVIVLLADCVGNYLVVGLPGSMNSRWGRLVKPSTSN